MDPVFAEGLDSNPVFAEGSDPDPVFGDVLDLDPSVAEWSAPVPILLRKDRIWFRFCRRV